MNAKTRRDPRDTKSRLGQAYWQHHRRVINDTQPKIMGHVTIDVLEGIESFAARNPHSNVARMHGEMLKAIGPHIPAGDPGAVARFCELYKSASDLVFPATAAFLSACHGLSGYSSSHSLSSIYLETLQAVDLEAHGDPALASFRKELKSRLEKTSGIDDVTTYSRAFETYGEIVAYPFLREHVPTSKIPERKDAQTPDFLCEPDDGKTFRVEVKTFDTAGGNVSKRDMLSDGLDAEVELEEQLRAGKSVASAVTEIAPFRKAGEKESYDPRSLIRVIDTLREKSLRSFKEGQFAAGPTFALAIVDRLLLPSGKFDLAPYYRSDFSDGGIASGVLWHMDYGRFGTPIFRLPDCAGANSLEGHLERYGLFVDETRPFPGPGLIVLAPGQDGRRAYGLVNHACPDLGDWTIDDTHDVLGRLCHRWNDEEASRSWDLSADIGAGSGIDG